MSKTARQKRLNEAIDRFAGLFEYGALMADTDPAELFNKATDEIIQLRALFESLRERLWHCDHCHRPDDPNACCRGQNFIPADPYGPWVCWMCGVDESAPPMADEDLLACDPMLAATPKRSEP